MGESADRSSENPNHAKKPTKEIRVYED